MKTTNLLFAFLSVILLVFSCSSKASKSPAEEIVQSITEKTFQSEVIDSKTPVLIEFYADWCRPCGKLSPIYKKLASKYKNKVKFVKIQVKSAPNLVESYNIESLPTMVFYSSKCKKGKELVGFAEEGELLRFLENCLEECK